jgi:hypothetical protein
MPAAHEGKHRIIDRAAICIISERSGETSSAAGGGDIIDSLPFLFYTYFRHHLMGGRRYERE